MKSTNLFSMCTIISISVILSGCATDDWTKANRENTAKSYAIFLLHNPESEHVNEAKERLKEIRWEKAVKSDNIKAYKHFITINPGSEHVTEAQDRIIELSWNKATQINTVSAYQEFVSINPDGKYSTEAKNKIEHMDNTGWEIAKNGNTYQDYFNYTEEFKNGKNIQEANNRMENMVNTKWNAALKNDTFEAYYNFIKEFNAFSGDKQPQQQFLKVGDETAFKSVAHMQGINGIHARKALESIVNKFPDKIYKDNPMCENCLQMGDIITCADGSSPEFRIAMDKYRMITSMETGCF